MRREGEREREGGEREGEREFQYCLSTIIPFLIVFFFYFFCIAGMTALMWGVVSGDAQCVALLLELGGDPTQCEAVFNENSLHLACRKGHVSVAQLLVQHAQQQQQQQQSQSVSRAFDSQNEYEPINLFRQRNVEGCTPLHFAAAGGHTAIVQVCKRNET